MGRCLTLAWSLQDQHRWPGSPPSCRCSELLPLSSLPMRSSRPSARPAWHGGSSPFEDITQVSEPCCPSPCTCMRALSPGDRLPPCLGWQPRPLCHLLVPLRLPSHLGIPVAATRAFSKAALLETSPHVHRRTPQPLLTPQ